jgi:hypothetical protein
MKHPIPARTPSGEMLNSDIFFLIKKGVFENIMELRRCVTWHWGISGFPIVRYYLFCGPYALVWYVTGIPVFVIFNPLLANVPVT